MAEGTPRSPLSKPSLATPHPTSTGGIAAKSVSALGGEASSASRWPDRLSGWLRRRPFLLPRSLPARPDRRSPPGPARRPCPAMSRRARLAGERGLASRPRRPAAPDGPDRLRKVRRLDWVPLDQGRAVGPRGGGRLGGQAFSAMAESTGAPRRLGLGGACTAGRRAARARSACSSPASSRPSSAGPGAHLSRQAPPGPRRARDRGEWSKDQILEAYLNLASFRGETQGIGAAARALFGKAPDALGRTTRCCSPPCSPPRRPIRRRSPGAPAGSAGSPTATS
jgi:penicillin-binding protein 1C